MTRREYKLIYPDGVPALYLSRDAPPVVFCCIEHLGKWKREAKVTETAVRRPWEFIGNSKPRCAECGSVLWYT